MKRKLLLLSIALALVTALIVPSLALAADPIVTITVSAKTIAITNTQATWNIGVVETGNVKYFSADNTQDDTYSQIANTGNVAVDVEIQGTNFVGTTYDWTLATAAGVETYALVANSDEATTYDIEVKSSATYNDIVTNLAKDGTYDWSMEFTAPSSFNASDTGDDKTATVTLVATEQGT